jgi:hypothetical protein
MSIYISPLLRAYDETLGVHLKISVILVYQLFLGAVGTLIIIQLSVVILPVNDNSLLAVQIGIIESS